MSQIAKFMGPTWGPPGSCRPQMGPMLAPWILLSGIVPSNESSDVWANADLRRQDSGAVILIVDLWTTHNDSYLTSQWIIHKLHVWTHRRVMIYFLFRNHHDSQQLAHWGRNKMGAFFQTTFSNAFSSIKMFEFQLTFHWSLFLRVQWIIFQHWFR